MKISELQELLGTAKKYHGDIEIAIYEKSPFFGKVPRTINEISVHRSSQGEIVKIDEPLSETGVPLLMFEYVEEEDDENE